MGIKFNDKNTTIFSEKEIEKIILTYFGDIVSISNFYTQKENKFWLVLTDEVYDQETVATVSDTLVVAMIFREMEKYFSRFCVHRVDLCTEENRFYVSITWKKEI